MDIISFDYSPGVSEKEFSYKLLVKDINVSSQHISGLVVNRLSKEELSEVESGNSTKEINEKAYRTFKVSKIKNLRSA